MLHKLYPPRVRAKLHVHPGQPSQPEHAAKLLGAELLSSLPHQRQVSVAVLALGPHPGLTPTPWVLGGLLAALVEAERTPVNFLTLGDHETGEALLRKAGRASAGPIAASELIERPSRDRTIDLRVADHPRPLSILRELVGTSLIVCAPLCFEARDHGPIRRWQGPIESTLAALAGAHGFSPPTPKLRTGLRPRPEALGRRSAVAVGHELLSACFASVALVCDATWAAALEASPGGAGSGSRSGSGRARGPDGRFIKVLVRPPPRAQTPTLLGELGVVDRVLGLGELGRVELAALRGADRWLISALGLDPRVDARAHAPEFVSSPGRWPQLSPTAPLSQPKRLADRAIAGIRGPARRLRGAPEPAALPARVPGPFAQLWTRQWYGEHELAARRRSLGAGARAHGSLR